MVINIHGWSTIFETWSKTSKMSLTSKFSHKYPNIVTKFTPPKAQCYKHHCHQKFRTDCLFCGYYCTRETWWFLLRVIRCIKLNLRMNNLIDMVSLSLCISSQIQIITSLIRHESIKNPLNLPNPLKTESRTKMHFSNLDERINCPVWSFEMGNNPYRCENPGRIAFFDIPYDTFKLGWIPRNFKIFILKPLVIFCWKIITRVNCQIFTNSP